MAGTKPILDFEAFAHTITRAPQLQQSTPIQQATPMQQSTPVRQSVTPAPLGVGPGGVPQPGDLQYRQGARQFPQPRDITPSIQQFQQAQQQQCQKQQQQPSLTQPISDSEPPTQVITNLMKIYQDSMKYTGELYDVLDTRIQLFRDNCHKVGLTQLHHGFSVMLTGRAASYYYDSITGRRLDFDSMVYMMKRHFETEQVRQFYKTEWRTITFQKTIDENTGKSRTECLRLLQDKLRKLSKALGGYFETDDALRDQIVICCDGIPECNLALFQPAPTYEGVCAQLRSAIATVGRSKQQFITEIAPDPEPPDQAFWVDRKFGGNGSYKGRGRPFRGRRGSRSSSRSNWKKRCYICKKEGCWSKNHPLEERQRSYEEWKGRSPHSPTVAYYQSFLAEWEGVEGLDQERKEDEVDQFLAEMAEEQLRGFEDSDEVWLTTDLGDINGPNTIATLSNSSLDHALTGIDQYNSEAPELVRYSDHRFEGIIPDTGAAGVSTVGEPQLRALQKIMDIQLDKATAGQHTIRFGKGEATSLGTVDVPTPFGPITFHVVPANTPFLYCVQDMDRMEVKLDNLRNVLIQRDITIPVVRKWGHPFLLLKDKGIDLEKSITSNHLTESELRQLHRRFGHPSVQRLVRILQRAGEEVEQRAIEQLTKFCHQCQIHGKSPGRFKFTLKDEYEFNYSIVVDVMYLDGHPVLHVVDEATAFQAARFLNDLSSKETWEQLRHCWIDVYQGPPDVIVTDAGKNFVSAEFNQNAKAMNTEVKEVPVEAHNSIGKVERYHATLRRSFEIIQGELPTVPKEMILQMAVKTVNDSAGPDGIIPTLLVFGAYPRIADSSPPNPSITQRAQAIQKAMKEVQHIHARRQIKDALAMRNGPDITAVLELPLQSEVLVWREKKGWTGPWKLIAVDGATCTVKMPQGPVNFRASSVKPYFAREDVIVVEVPKQNGPETVVESDTDTGTDDPRRQSTNNGLEGIASSPSIVVKRGRGRPRGSKNKAYVYDVFLTAKERADFELAVRLRKEGVITEPGEPYELSDKKEIEGLLGRGVFGFELYDEGKHGKLRIYSSRMVREVKGKATPTPYEKSRLVIQAFNDEGKTTLLTQAPTIQRCSQRLIVALFPTLSLHWKLRLWLRDVTQAYTRSTTLLQRRIYAYLPKEIRHLFPEGTIMAVLRPLYGIPEAGTHWWSTYFNHHKDKLHMQTSTYDPCLLVTTAEERRFGIVGMQTDDTLGLSDLDFEQLEEQELRNADFPAKPKEVLSRDNSIQFNGCIVTMSKDSRSIHLRQKNQGNNIQLVKDTDDYIQQRARGAYIASTCQPEASYDLSVAAQQREPDATDIRALNKRLQWQIDNIGRGLQYIPLELESARLYVFVDGSFANNKDLSSQIGFVIILGNEASQTENEFRLNGNLVHWSSTKSKRVTRSTLASEIYGMVAGTDIAFAISTTLKMVTDKLGVGRIPTIVCTDSYSLYECLVKLGTTKEKRLMIDIMALRQSYERRELYEIRWINGNDNPADAMTKSTPNKALETFVLANEVTIRLEGWVKRGGEVRSEAKGR
jgi:hypothetical protein